MKPILIISGPTASGKTGLAIKLMKLLNGELISADSRQIYKGFDIGTGKDHPKNIKIHMIDILDPNEQYSVTQYRQTALPLIEKIQKKGKLPIIVGGTGQYIQSLIEDSRETFHIGPNKFLRFFLNKLSVKFLQKIYKFLDKEKYNQLNNSDIHNPHRLIRKIEIRLSNKGVIARSPATAGRRSNPDGINNYLHISLTAPNSYLFKNIDQRVDERIKMGLFNEIRNLLKKYPWSAPAFRTHAYKEFEGVIARNPPTGGDEAIPMEVIQKWHYDEHRYVHRQKTWFRKMPNVHFFDITSSKYPQDVIDFVLKCYNKL
jgi:tRNA dimethylallyltransferase